MELVFHYQMLRIILGWTKSFAIFWSHDAQFDSSRCLCQDCKVLKLDYVACLSVELSNHMQSEAIHMLPHQVQQYNHNHRGVTSIV